MEQMIDQSKKFNTCKMSWKAIICLQKSRRPHTYVRLCARPGSTWEGPQSHLCLTMRLCVSRKWRLRQSWQLLSECWRHALVCIKSIGEDWKSFWPQVFREISVQSLMNAKWTEWRLEGQWPHVTKNTDCTQLV